MNKKGNFLVGALLILCLVLGLYLFQIFSYECVRDEQCGSESYCGVDHQCHAMPTITKSDYIKPAAMLGAFIGLAIIISTIIKERSKNKPNTFYQSENK